VSYVPGRQITDFIQSDGVFLMKLDMVQRWIWSRRRSKRLWSLPHSLIHAHGKHDVVSSNLAALEGSAKL
jgi:hypothetical protein